jgi:hypothetical protein
MQLIEEIEYLSSLIEIKRTLLLEKITDIENSFTAINTEVPIIISLVSPLMKPLEYVVPCYCVPVFNT